MKRVIIILLVVLLYVQPDVKISYH